MNVDPSHDDDAADGMAAPPRVSRRRLLVGMGSLGVAGLVTAGGLAVGGGPTSGAMPPALAANLARLPGVEHLRAIGDAVVAAEVLDGPADELVALIAPEGVTDPAGWCAGTEPTVLRDHVADTAERDFTTGAVLEVDGWRLSRTEAALSALVALS